MAVENETAHYDLSLYEREVAAHESAAERHYRALHTVLAHIDGVLREGGLLQVSGDGRSKEVRLPWSYYFRPRGSHPEVTEYSLNSGRARTLVASTMLWRSGEFSSSSDQELLAHFDDDLRNGYLDRVAQYASASTKQRAEMLKVSRYAEEGFGADGN